MDSRIVQFIAALRASGVRVSLAESQDAMAAIADIGVLNRDQFRAALQTTLVKDHGDAGTFAQLFPLFFGAGGPNMVPPHQALTDDQQEMLREALQALAGELNDLLQRLLEGRDFTQEELERMGRRAGLEAADGLRYEEWITKRMQRQAGLEQVLDRIQQLLDQLAEMGLPPEMLNQLANMLLANADAASEQTQRFVGQTLAERLAESEPVPPQPGPDLMDRPFDMLSARETRELKQQVQRLAARLRTRAALRRKRGRGPILDAKRTIRANIEHGGVPFDMRFKRRTKKPKFTVIIDVSTSMRPVVDFLLLLMYQIQDEIGRTRSFAFIDHIEDVSDVFGRLRPEEAIPIVLRRLPPGYYNTDLGASLDQFTSQHLGTVDHRTTVLFCGDGRNNFNDPRIDLVDLLRRRARRVVWFTPEPESKWGTGDSAMHDYARAVDQVFRVATLRQLTDAIDALL